MASIALLVMILVAGASAATDRLPHDQNPQPPIDADLTMSVRHELRMAKHGRVYKDAAEKERRLKIFRQKVEDIDAFNRDEHHTYKIGLNQFSDLTYEEFTVAYTEFNDSGWPANPETMKKYENMSDVYAPSAVNYWIEQGVVIGVKDQNACGSCWAFAVAAVMEGVVKINSGIVLSFSEQELVDCDVHGSNKGCYGGSSINAYKFIIEHRGMATEDIYPYRKEQGSCAWARHLEYISGYETIQGEQSLMLAVANQPVAVSIFASGKLVEYMGDMFRGPCDVHDVGGLNHGVTVVGYGTDGDTGMSYWLVKNSWGEQWGEGGCIRMHKDVGDANGLCGIAIRPVCPIY